MKRFFLCLAAMLCLTMLPMSAAKLSPYSRAIVSQFADQVSLTKEDAQLRVPTLKTVANVQYVSAFVHVSPDFNSDELKPYNVIVNAKYDGIWSTRIPVDKLEQVSELSGVLYVEVATPVRRKLKAARASANVDNAHSALAPLTTPYKGKDVVVGIIDYGFQYDHVNFFDEAGTAFRVKRVWNQNKQTGPAPANFVGGTEYATESAILAAGYDDNMDDVGHATHVAGIAAGAYVGNSNANYGVAPQADLVFVSYDTYDNSSDNISITNGVKYIYDYATSVGKPAVINMSLGSHMGPHDGTSTFDQVCDQLAGPGRLLVGSAGNEGGDQLHASKTFASTTDTLKTGLAFYSSSAKYCDLDIWGDKNKPYSVKVSIIQASNNKEVFTSGYLSALTSFTKTYSSFSTFATGSIMVSTGKDYNNEKGNVYVGANLSKLNSGFYISIQIVGEVGNKVNVWADDYYSYLSSNGLKGHVSGDAEMSVGEIGGTGNKIISVGAYVSTARSGYGGSKNSLASFSSKGPTADGRIKPDVVAPGSVLISSLPNWYAVVNGDYTDLASPAYYTVNSKKYYFGYMQGTSMSSPFVAGVMALWLQANPKMTPELARVILSRTSTADNFTGAVPNNVWGYGKIDAYKGLLEVIATSDNSEVVSHPTELLMYPNPATSEFNLQFTSADDHVTVSIYTLSGQRILTQNLGSVTVANACQVELPTLAEGVYVVHVKGDKVSHAERLFIKK